MPVVDSPQASHFVPAKHFKVANGRRVDIVVLHCTVNKPGRGVAEAVAVACENQPADTKDPSSFHYVCGGDDVIQCVAESDIAWAAPGASTQGVHVEHVGMPGMSWQDWLASGAPQKSAPLVRCICRRVGVPAVFVAAEALLLGARGVTTHWEVTQAVRLARARKLTGSPFFAKDFGHYDPGPGFDVSAFLEMVRGEAQS